MDACINISIVTYHTSTDELRRCLDSLRSPAVRRITIIDNSSDPAMERFCASIPQVVYRPNANTGYGPAHNLALRDSLLDHGARYHLVLNSDVYFSPDILGRIVEFMDSRPEVGQLQPEVIYPNGKLQYACRLLPTPIDVIGRRFLPKRWMRSRNRRYTLADMDRSREHNIPFHQGSFMMFRIEALRREGLFDERFFMYPEDIDITRRIHRHWLTLYWPGATIVHAHRAQSYTDRRLLRIHCVNMIRYFCKWGWWFDPERRRLNRRVLAEEL